LRLQVLDASTVEGAVDVFEIVDFKNLLMPQNIFVHDPHRAPVDPLYMPDHLSPITLTSSGANVAEGFDTCKSTMLPDVLRMLWAPAVQVSTRTTLHA
jgi:hypothetical protein